MRFKKSRSTFACRANFKKDNEFQSKDMLTKNQTKLIRSLKSKKYRNSHQLFVAEGNKVVLSILASVPKLEYLILSESSEFASEYDKYNPIFVSEKEFNSLSQQTTPQGVLAVFNYFQKNLPDPERSLVLAFDQINDPGNLGAIIRLADWFDIRHIVCSLGSADVYGAKCVQSSAGSISRVNVHTVDLKKYLEKANAPTIGVTMEGESLYSSKLPNYGMCLFGNEANGISQQFFPHIDQLICIPSFSDKKGLESLNVATSASILVSELKRQSLKL